MSDLINRQDAIGAIVNTTSREDEQMGKSETCPVCEYVFEDCQCRFDGKSHPDRWKRAKVVAEHIYLLSSKQLEHLKKVQEWWHTSYDDEELTQILKELES